MALALGDEDGVVSGLRLSDLSMPEFHHSKPHTDVWVLRGSCSGDEVSCLSVVITLPNSRA